MLVGSAVCLFPKAIPSCRHLPPFPCPQGVPSVSTFIVLTAQESRLYFSVKLWECDTGKCQSSDRYMKLLESRVLGFF